MIRAGWDLMLFMIVNWMVPRDECEKKLELMKVWCVKVADCCFDAGYRYAVPEFWTEKDMVEFRAKCRLHNLLVNFGIYPS